jgi:hypothetical protein
MKPDSDEHYCFQWCGRMQWACVCYTTGRDCNWVLARRLGHILPGRVESWGEYQQIDGTKPYHAIPFPVPKSLEATTKTEMKRLTDIDVFNISSDSEWAAPTFMQAKKTGDVRILTDFRRLNAQIKRKPFPLPKISDLLRKLSGFKYATAIDLSMGYYHIPLDLEAQKLCTTILPWGK